MPVTVGRSTHWFTGRRGHWRIGDGETEEKRAFLMDSEPGENVLLVLWWVPFIAVCLAMCIGSLLMMVD